MRKYCIFRVQHTPDVVCEQDVSDILRALPNKKFKTAPLLKSNPYPKTYAYTPYEYFGEEDAAFLNRYDGKDKLP